jgi:hypothetical protein
VSASIIESLVISGSRKSDGSANASGKVWAYLPNTSTTAQLYSDVAGTLVLTQPLVLDAGGLVPRATAPDGVFTSIPIRLYIEDADGVVVADTLFTPATASTVSVDNVAMSGATMDDVLTASLTSFGGQDFKYRESGGATSRTVHDKFQEQGIWVTDFPDVDPTGVALSTTGIQAAINRAKTLSCNLYFPDGSFRYDQALVLDTATGVQIIGAGRGATLLKPTNATANALTLATCTDCGVHGLSILHTTGSTGAGIAASASPRLKISDVYIPANGTFVGFAYGIDLSGAGDFDHISYCDVNADTVALRSNTTSSAKPQMLIGSQFGASSAAPVSPTSGIEINGGNGYYTIIGARIYGATNNLLFNAAWTGTTVRIYGGDMGSVLGSTAINLSGFANDRDVRWVNCGVDGYTVNVLSGATVTPDRAQGPQIRIRGTTTGIAYVVAAPTPAPSLGSTRDIDLYLTFFNNAGGAVTGWTLDAAYHMDAVSTVNLEYTSYHLKWDADASVWRQFSRSVST